MSSSDKTLTDLSNSMIVPELCDDANMDIDMDISCLENDDELLPPMSPRPNSPITTHLADFVLDDEIKANLNHAIEDEVAIAVEDDVIPTQATNQISSQDNDANLIRVNGNSGIGEITDVRLDDTDSGTEIDRTDRSGTSTTTTSTIDVSVNSDASVNSNANVSSDTGIVGNSISIFLNTKLGIIDTIKNQLIQEFTTLLYNIDTPLNKTGLLKLMVRAMEMVETTSVKDGKERLDIVIDALTYILNSDAIVCPNKDQLISFLTHDANDLIAIIIDASKGKININKLENMLIKTLKRLLTCICLR